MPNASKGLKLRAKYFAMLTALRIKNLALVEDLTIDFQPGYNAITGETGAGKSILIGALNLVLGERASKSLIRSGADKCTVEAAFDTAKIKAPIAKWLDQNGLEECADGQLFLKRTFSAGGTNRQFINGSPTSLNHLAQIGEWLVDIHGPHDHQSLLHPSRQLALLDAFAGLESAVEKFGQLLQQRRDIEAERADFIVDEQTYEQQLDLLRFQVKEIAAAQLDELDEAGLEAEHQRVSNASQLMQLAGGALELLNGEDDSLTNQVNAVSRLVQDLNQIDAGAGNLVELQEDVTSLVQDLQSEVSAYLDRLDVNPVRLQELEDQVGNLQSLKRKFGPSLDDVRQFGEKAADKLASLESRDAEVARLNSELERLSDRLIKDGKTITTKRSKVIAKLSREVVKQLRALGFKQSEFAVALGTLTTPNQTGFDRIEFQFAPNPGEPSQSLRAIASSGEMARIMLAIKTVLAEQDRVPLLIFDEVDANVGGETAHVVGDKMRHIATNRQVLCVTHLPQVAAAAAHHQVVTKQVTHGRTISLISPVTDQDRINEIIRMLGGKGEAIAKHAEELLSS
ncbi:MAG: DNA repair protein RecN (Recombination protein N) [Limisphaerales bacterium]